MALSSHYDLILMDIHMPVMDGYTAVETIREWETRTNRARTPIMALTASALSESVHRTMEAGFDLHVSKPIRRAALLNAIAQVYLGRDDGGEHLPLIEAPRAL
jgi:CheY-like chemotaxis protein